MILYINACARKESRTKKLADHLLTKLDGEVTQIDIAERSFPLCDEAFIDRRVQLIDEGKFDDPIFDLARQFAGADQIVIAAPYWDLSFPACLKEYFQQICVTEITFRYTEEGYPEGLCKAKDLYYVTTAGGEYFPEEYGFGYVKELATAFYQIPHIEQFYAKGLDIIGHDPEQIMQDAFDEIDRRFAK